MDGDPLIPPPILPPPPAIGHDTDAGTTAPQSSKKTSTKTSGSIAIGGLPAMRIKELQGTIAVWLYSEMKCNTPGKTEQMQCDYMFELYHGFPHPHAGTAKRTTLVAYSDNALANSSGAAKKLAAYDQFLRGYGAYSLFWNPGPALPTRNILHFKDELSQDYFRTTVAEVNLSRRELATSENKRMNTFMSGHAIWELARKTLAETKNILSLVPHAVEAKIIKKEDGAFIFYSGKNHMDFVKFILFLIYNWKILYGSDVAAAPAALSSKRVSGSAPDLNLKSGDGVNPVEDAEDEMIMIDEGKRNSEGRIDEEAAEKDADGDSFDGEDWEDE
jgi:hypothetical protein